MGNTKMFCGSEVTGDKPPTKAKASIAKIVCVGNPIRACVPVDPKMVKARVSVSTITLSPARNGISVFGWL